MKQIIILLLLFISTAVNGQVKRLEIPPTDSIMIEYFDFYSRNGYIKNLNTDSVLIVGDTIAIVRELMRDNEQLQKAIYSKDSLHRQLEKATINFVNTVPYIWKNSKEWKRFWALLKKRGYVMINKKPQP